MKTSRRIFLAIEILAATVLAAGLARAQAQSTIQSPDPLDRARTMLATASQDKNPDQRKNAAEAMSLEGATAGVIERLGAMLSDADVPVRISVVTALGGFKDQSTIPFLKKALQDSVPEVQFTSAKALFQLNDPDGKQFLLSVIAGQSKASSNYLSKQKRDTLRMLHTPTKLLTPGIAAAFVPVPGVALGLSSAQGIMADPDASARAAALLLLAAESDSSTANAVQGSLSDKDWSVRAAAVHVAATHPYPALREDLVPLLDDKKAPVRLRAAAAYIRLAPRARH